MSLLQEERRLLSASSGALLLLPWPLWPSLLLLRPCSSPQAGQTPTWGTVQQAGGWGADRRGPHAHPRRTDRRGIPPQPQAFLDQSTEPAHPQVLEGVTESLLLGDKKARSPSSSDPENEEPRQGRPFRLPVLSQPPRFSFVCLAHSVSFLFVSFRSQSLALCLTQTPWAHISQL